MENDEVGMLLLVLNENSVDVTVEELCAVDAFAGMLLLIVVGISVVGKAVVDCSTDGMPVVAICGTESVRLKS